MITIRRADERRHDRHRKQDVWATFFEQAPTEPLAGGFGALDLLNEGRVPPAAVVVCPTVLPPSDAEIVTYVHEGVLAYEDSTGRSGIIAAGEFHRRNAGRTIRHSETNASRTDSAHLFRIWLRPLQSGLEPGDEQRRFGMAERRNGLCVVASPDGRRGSLRIRMEALIFSAVLDSGQHVVRELGPGRGAWLHIVQGSVTLENMVLTAGDGAGITTECAVSLTARERTEILLLEVGGLQQGLLVDEPGPVGRDVVS